MEIRDIEPLVVGTPEPHNGGRNWVFVKVTTADGAVGWGECSWVNPRAQTVVQAINEQASRVIGSDPFDIERIRDNLYASSHFLHVEGPIQAQVIAAIETACWDIIGKATGQPIYNLLGGKANEELRTYSYIHYRWDVSDLVNEAAEAAEKYLEEGYTGVKVDPISPAIGPRDVPTEELSFAEDVVRSIREAVGDQCDILVGTHGQLHTQEAVRLADRIEPYDPLWLEEPVPPEKVDEMAAVAESTSVPVATGERVTSQYEFCDLIEAGAVQILQLNMGMLGILQARKVAAMAESHHLQIAPWMYCGPIHGVASIHIDTCSPNFLIQESIEDWDRSSIHNEILTEPIEWEDGYIKPPDGPGLGTAIDEEVIEAYPANKSEDTGEPPVRKPSDRFRP